MEEVRRQAAHHLGGVEVPADQGSAVAHRPDQVAFPVSVRQVAFVQGAGRVVRRLATARDQHLPVAVGRRAVDLPPLLEEVVVAAVERGRLAQAVETDDECSCD